MPTLTPGVAVSTSRNDAAWDRFVDTTPGGNHLQTARWARVKASAGLRPLRLQLLLEETPVAGCQLLVRSLPVGSLAYCPLGPLAPESDEDALCAMLDAVEHAARRERILYVKIQPPRGRGDIEAALRDRHFVVSDLPATPVATVLVRLARTPDELLAAMRPTTRRNVRSALRSGVVVRATGSGGLSAFGELLSKAKARRERGGLNDVSYPLEYYARIMREFGPHAEVMLAEREGRVESGLLIVAYGDSAVVKMAAWSGAQTKHRTTELLHWHAMQWAQDLGCHYYDLDGIDVDVARAIVAGEGVPEGGRSGTTNFKLGLGGEVRLAPPAYDRSYQRVLALPARALAPRLSRLNSRAHRIVGRVPSKR